MKKILILLGIIFVAVFYATPAFSCSLNEKDIMTGAACSVKELNEMQRNNFQQERINVNPEDESDFRPLKNKGKKGSEFHMGCPYGMCIQKSLFKTLF